MSTVDTPAAPAGTQIVEEPGRLKALLANQQVILFLVWIGLVIGFTAMNPVFFSQGVAANVLADWGPLVLIAVGELFVVVSGGIDLSVGGVVGFSGVVGALAMKSLTESGQTTTPTLVVGLAICLAIGSFVGLINALLVNVAGLVPFIATLVTLGATAGLSLVITQGAPVMGGPPDAIMLVNSWVGPFSKPMLVIILIVVLLWAFLHKARFGRYTFAIGSNPFAARAAGIDTKRHLTKVYVLSGFLAGLAGFYFYLRLNGGGPTSGSGMELDAIAAVVIGGAALTGGVGRVSGVALGALILTTVTSGLIIAGVNPSWKRVVVAALIAIAATIQALRKTEGGAS